jgi:hypothetical protein
MKIFLDKISHGDKIRIMKTLTLRNLVEATND